MYERSLMTSAVIEVRPVRTEEDHDAGLMRIQELMEAEPEIPASDELEILIALVDAYESKHFPIDAPDSITMILFHMDQQGMSRKELAPMIGSRVRVSEVLSRKRNLTLNMIRRLSAALKLPADLLIALPQKRHISLTPLMLRVGLAPHGRLEAVLERLRRTPHGLNRKSHLFKQNDGALASSIFIRTTAT